MENKKNTKSVLIFILLIVAFVVAVGLIPILIFYKNCMPDVVYDILLEVEKALIVSVLLGYIAKLISEDIFLMKKNDSKLRKIGIFEIGEGYLNYKQTNIMFGGCGYKYPKELKFLFISGNLFMEKFEFKILTALKHGCDIKVLIADPNKSKDFLERAEVLCPQIKDEGSYSAQIKKTSELIKKIQNQIKINNYEGKIEVRYYIDEYRYNYRLGLYGEHCETIRLWANFQPPNKDAVDLSLVVHGIYNNDKEKDSIVLELNNSFDQLWDKYENNSKTSK